MRPDKKQACSAKAATGNFRISECSHRGKAQDLVAIKRKFGETLKSKNRLLR
jgi:hypothetical protein